MTSNIGSQYLLEGIDDAGRISSDAHNAVDAELRAHFRPEFLNRLDEIIEFRPLTKANIRGIVELLIADTNRRLADRQLSIRLTDEAKQFVTDAAYDPSFGARPLKRYIQKHVETLSARLILKDEVEEGDTIEIFINDGALDARVVKQ